MFREDVFDATAAQSLLQNLDEQRDAVARTVGAVAVEGPDAVAGSAEYTARAIQELAGRLRDWLAFVMGGEDREELVTTHGRYERDDERYAEQGVSTFTAECRAVLHPARAAGRLTPGCVTGHQRQRRRLEQSFVMSALSSTGVVLDGVIAC